MKLFVFHNAGVIDAASIRTFGVSSKEGEGAIGFFGTGLKYAIAILLRLGCKITIHAGEEVLEFDTERARIRVDDFDFVRMNGERLGFTTELGKTWEMWQAFREIFCNCKDENGHIYETNEMPVPLAGHTTIVVSGELFHDVWADRSKIILESKPLFQHMGVHIHGQPSKYLYYRGIRAYELNEASLFTYDIQRKQDLSEDRSIKHLWGANQAIREGLLAMDSRSMIHRAVFAAKGTMESSFDFKGVLPGDTFTECVLGWRQSREMGMNPSAFEAIRPWVMDRLHDAAPYEMTDVEKAALDAALDFCEKIGYPVRDYPLTVTDYLGDSVLGMAEDGKIYLSKRVFMMGTKMVAGTLIEEYIHLSQHLYDETRGLQNYLIDALVSLGERYLGEKL